MKDKLVVDPSQDFTELEKAKGCKHLVKRGVSVERIAQMLDVSVAEVEAWLRLAEHGPD